MSSDGALLLAIDVGNTNISLGLFDSARVRLSTLQTVPVVRREPVELQHSVL